RRARQRRQAAHRRQLHAAAKARRATAIAATGTQDERDQLEFGERPADVDGSLEAAADGGSKIEMATTEPREALWAGYCRFALNRRCRGELLSFQDDLRSGRCRGIEAPQLLNAAIEFVIQRGNLRPRRWSPAPTDQQLEDLLGCITQRLAEEHAEQKTAER